MSVTADRNIETTVDKSVTLFDTSIKNVEDTLFDTSISDAEDILSERNNNVEDVLRQLNGKSS